MYLKVHCCTIFMSDLDSWDSVDAKNGLKHRDWTPDTRDRKCVLKWVLVRIAALCCATRPQIWIPETKYYQKVSSHAQIGPQGAEKQLRKVVVGGCWVVGGVWCLAKEQNSSCSESDQISGACQFKTFRKFLTEWLAEWVTDIKTPWGDFITL